MNNQQKKNHDASYTFYVQGMHCPSCVIVTENEISDVPEVATVKADLNTLSVTVTGQFDTDDPERIAQKLTQPMEKHGYAITTTPEKKHTVQWNDFIIALPIALACILLFLLLQKMGIVQIVNTAEVNYATAFAIGIVASLSTCMAVVGGLVLSLSATFHKTHSGIRPQILFHIGRLVTFALLGGLIGAIGSRFVLHETAELVLNILIAFVLILLGINLLDIFPWAQKLQPKMPKKVSQSLLRIQKVNTSITPLLIGAVTFFLPCGFTQSMQLYTLTTGSFFAGSMTMLFFALGTLPVLLVISMSSAKLKKPKTRSIFFKAAGCIVLFFAILNILGILTALAIIPPIITL